MKMPITHKKALFTYHPSVLKIPYMSKTNNSIAQISSMPSKPMVPYRTKPKMYVKTNRL